MSLQSAQAYLAKRPSSTSLSGSSVYAHKGEMVMNHKTTSKYRDVLEGVHEGVQIRDAKKLVRVIINCNNKNKAGYTGDIFSAHNAYVSETKFIPFGTPTHITQIMFNTLKEKKCQQFKKVKLPNGQEITRPYVIDEFNIEILPPLTKDELEAIKKKQLAEGFNGE